MCFLNLHNGGEDADIATKAPIMDLSCLAALTNTIRYHVLLAGIK